MKQPKCPFFCDSKPMLHSLFRSRPSVEERETSPLKLDLFTTPGSVQAVQQTGALSQAVIQTRRTFPSPPSKLPLLQYAKRQS